MVLFNWDHDRCRIISPYLIYVHEGENVNYPLKQYTEYVVKSDNKKKYEPCSIGKGLIDLIRCVRNGDIKFFLNIPVGYNDSFINDDLVGVTHHLLDNFHVQSNIYSTDIKKKEEIMKFLEEYNFFVTGKYYLRDDSSNKTGTPIQEVGLKMMQGLRILN